jgi:hypothetical protein
MMVPILILVLIPLFPFGGFSQSPGIHAPTGQGSPLVWNDETGPWTGGFNATCAAADWNHDGYADLMVHYEKGSGAKNTMWGTFLYLNTGDKHRSGYMVFEQPKRMR